MIDLFKKLLGTQDTDRQPEDAHQEPAPAGPPRDVRLATCAIFLEMANIDDEFTDEERERILSMLEDEYDLTREDVIELQNASKGALDKSLDVWKFTNVINEHYSSEEKCRIVEMLWELVYVDNKLDEHENYFMHKLAGLLRLTHRDLIDAKVRVLERKRT
ncbi:MAG: TerB family tellurite resistance protein [bacterium]